MQSTEFRARRHRQPIRAKLGRKMYKALMSFVSSLILVGCEPAQTFNEAVPQAPATTAPASRENNVGAFKEGAWVGFYFKPPNQPLPLIASTSPNGKFDEGFSLTALCTDTMKLVIYVYAQKIIGNVAMDGKSTVQVSFAFDEQPARTENWTISQASAASPQDSAEFARKLMVHRSVMIRVKEPNSSILGKFDLNGSPSVIGTIMDFCHIPH